MNRDRNQFAERWLNEALARYSDAEPRDGFEGRIMANLAARGVDRVPGWRRWMWVPVACAAVAALVVGISVLRPAAKTPTLATPVAAVSNPAPVQTQTPRVAVKETIQTATATRPRIRASQQLIARTAAKTAEPRKPQFPTSMPATQQEQLLAAYLNATPTHELLAVAADQRQWREQVRKNAESAAHESAPAPDINHLQVSPPEGGSTEAGAYGAR